MTRRFAIKSAMYAPDGTKLRLWRRDENRTSQLAIALRGMADAEGDPDSYAREKAKVAKLLPPKKVIDYLLCTEEEVREIAADLLIRSTGDRGCRLVITVYAGARRTLSIARTFE